MTTHRYLHPPLPCTPVRLQAIIAGLRDSVRDFSASTQDISSKDVLELMLITQ